MQQQQLQRVELQLLQHLLQQAPSELHPMQQRHQLMQLQLLCSRGHLFLELLPPQQQQLHLRELQLEQPQQLRLRQH
jgi:hypothetical protein